MRKPVWNVFAATVALMSLPVMAAAVDSVRVRIAGYRELGAAFKAANDGLRGDAQIVLLQQSARQISNAAKQQYGWFPAGSGPQPGIKTAAKPIIWANPGKFKAAQDAFARQAESFRKAANGGNVALLRVEVRKLGLTCKACHSQFRTEVD